jgi:hypothetical protein
MEEGDEWVGWWENCVVVEEAEEIEGVYIGLFPVEFLQWKDSPEVAKRLTRSNWRDYGKITPERELTDKPKSVIFSHLWLGFFHRGEEFDLL